MDILSKKALHVIACKGNEYQPPLLLEKFFDELGVFSAEKDRRDSVLYMDPQYPWDTNDKSVRQWLLKTLLEQSDGGYIHVRVQPEHLTVRASRDTMVKEWKRLPSTTKLDEVIGHMKAQLIPTTRLEHEAWGIDTCAMLNSGTLTFLKHDHLKLLALTAAGHYRGVGKNEIDKYEEGEPKAVSRASSHIIKMLMHHGIVVKLAVVRDARTFTSRVWLSVYAPRPGTHVLLPDNEIRHVTQEETKKQIMERLEAAHQRLLVQRDISVAFKVKKEILSKLRGDLERRGLIESVLINVAGDDNDKKNKDKDKKRTVKCWRMLKPYELPSAGVRAGDDDDDEAKPRRKAAVGTSAGGNDDDADDDSDADDADDAAEEADDDDDDDNDDADGEDDERGDGERATSGGQRSVYNQLEPRPMWRELSITDNLLDVVRAAGAVGAGCREVGDCLGLTSPQDQKWLNKQLAALAKTYGLESTSVHVGKARLKRYIYPDDPTAKLMPGVLVRRLSAVEQIVKDASPAELAEAIRAVERVYKSDPDTFAATPTARQAKKRKNKTDHIGEADAYKQTVAGRALLVAQHVADQRVLSATQITVLLRKLENNPKLDRTTVRRALLTAVEMGRIRTDTTQLATVSGASRDNVLYVAPHVADDDEYLRGIREHPPQPRSKRALTPKKAAPADEVPIKVDRLTSMPITARAPPSSNVPSTPMLARAVMLHCALARALVPTATAAAPAHFEFPVLLRLLSESERERVFGARVDADANEFELATERRRDAKAWASMLQRLRALGVVVDDKGKLTLALRLSLRRAPAADVELFSLEASDATSVLLRAWRFWLTLERACLTAGVDDTSALVGKQHVPSATSARNWRMTSRTHTAPLPRLAAGELTRARHCLLTDAIDTLSESFEKIATDNSLSLDALLQAVIEEEHLAISKQAGKTAATTRKRRASSTDTTDGDEHDEDNVDNDDDDDDNDDNSEREREELRDDASLPAAERARRRRRRCALRATRVAGIDKRARRRALGSSSYTSAASSMTADDDDSDDNSDDDGDGERRQRPQTRARRREHAPTKLAHVPPPGTRLCVGVIKRAARAFVDNLTLNSSEAAAAAAATEGGAIDVRRAPLTRADFGADFCAHAAPTLQCSVGECEAALGVVLDTPHFRAQLHADVCVALEAKRVAHSGRLPALPAALAWLRTHNAARAPPLPAHVQPQLAHMGVEDECGIVRPLRSSLSPAHQYLGDLLAHDEKALTDVDDRWHRLAVAASRDRQSLARTHKPVRTFSSVVSDDSISELVWRMTRDRGIAADVNAVEGGAIELIARARAGFAAPDRVALANSIDTSGTLGSSVRIVSLVDAPPLLLPRQLDDGVTPERLPLLRAHVLAAPVLAAVRTAAGGVCSAEAVDMLLRNECARGVVALGSAGECPVHALLWALCAGDEHAPLQRLVELRGDDVTFAYALRATSLRAGAQLAAPPHHSARLQRRLVAIATAKPSVPLDVLLVDLVGAESVSRQSALDASAELLVDGTLAASVGESTSMSLFAPSRTVYVTYVTVARELGATI